MSRKKKDVYEKRKEEKLAQERNSPTINEKYPGVATIVIDQEYIDHDPPFNVSSSQKTFYSLSKSFFWLPCPHWECVDGGFDLGPAVRDMYDSRAIEKPGEIDCQGWQDRERVHKNRCLLKLRYKILVEYE